MVTFLIVPGFFAGDAPALGLRARNVDGQLVIEWNRDAPELTGSRKSMLRIRERENVWEFDMGPDDLRSGALTFIPSGGDVEIEFTVEGAGASPLTEVTRVVGLPKTSAGTASQADQARTTALEEQVRLLREELENETRRAAALREQIEAAVALTRQ
jgi:hypothetical protein